ncbi:MAG: cytochrome b/b6 domain-containing protein, partial [Pseudomonadales bacterium]|nr:cytochrome b/b6 domain-containing protein [Pseudomonadales bacterium]
MLKNTDHSYGLVSIVFHWLFLILIITTIIIIGLAEEMPDGPEKLANIGLHKSIGVLLLVLVALRLIWRLNNVRPEPLGANPLENKLGHLMHLIFYVLLFAQPVFG